MKRFLKLLIRLYPASWRARYGDEMDALLDDARPRWTDLLDLTRAGLVLQVRQVNTAKLAFTMMAVGASVPVAVLFLQPALYESRAEFRVVRDIAYTQDLLIRALGNDRLEPVLAKHKLFPDGKMPERMDRFRRHIMAGGPRGDTRMISFQHTDPSVAREVSRELVDVLAGVGLPITKGAGEASLREPFYWRYAARGLIAGLLLSLCFVLVRRLVPAA